MGGQRPKPQICDCFWGYISRLFGTVALNPNRAVSTTTTIFVVWLALTLALSPEERE